MLVEISYLGPTNTKGSRLKAKCNQGSRIISWNYNLSDEEKALAAAESLWDKFNCAKNILKRDGTIETIPATKYESKTIRIVGYLNNKTYVKIDVVY